MEIIAEGELYLFGTEVAFRTDEYYGTLSGTIEVVETFAVTVAVADEAEWLGLLWVCGFR